MKIASPDQSFIDYWYPYLTWYAGIRVWKDRCCAISTKPGNDPSMLEPIEDTEYAIPLSNEMLDGPRHTDCIAPLILNIIRYCSFWPDSQLREVLSGVISFDDVLAGAETNSDPTQEIHCL